MKHPFWLINSVLLILFLIIGSILFFMPSSLPDKQSFLPEKESKPTKATMPKIDLGKIYTNDLFGTYKEPPLKPIEVEKEKPLPLPPTIQQPKAVEKTAPTFMAPLEIALRGVMISETEEFNTAIIEDIKTKLAKNYYIGDKIQDAQLIRIARNKIMLIRANGQQETLYLNKHDAEIDQLLTQDQNWTSVIKKAGASNYEVDPLEFIKRVHNLTQFIDMLNLTTVYQKGESIGCRVGGLNKNSLGESLGLKVGDIITKINNIPATTTNNRYDIYKLVTDLHENDTITMEITRKTVPLTLTYTLKNFKVKTSDTKEKPEEKQQPYDIDQEKRKVLERKYRFAPSAQELKKQDKQAMNHINPSRKNTRKRDVLIQPLAPETHIGT